MTKKRLMRLGYLIALCAFCCGSAFATTYSFTAVVSGGETEVYGNCRLNQRTGDWICTLLWNAGRVSLTANGTSVAVSYGQTSTYQSVASALCAAMTPSFPVQCTGTSGGTLNLTETQYNTISVSSTSNYTDPNNIPPQDPTSFPITLPPITGILYPKYQIQSIIYSAPGNRSSNGFTATTTDGGVDTVGNSFQAGETFTFSLSGGFLGVGSTISWNYGNSLTTGNSTAVTSTISQATGVANASAGNSSPNAINHQQDLFILWINPAISFTQTGGSSATYSPGTQLQTSGDPSPGHPEIQDQVEVFAQSMMANAQGATTVPLGALVQQVIDGQTLPGLANICANPIYYPNSCTQANQCGCVPSDFAAILSADPLLNYSPTTSPLNADTSGATNCTNPKASASCRYVPVMVTNGSSTQITELLEGPTSPGGNYPVNTFTQTDSTQTTQTLSEALSTTVGYSWEQMWKPLGTGLSIKSQTQFTWTNTESTGAINGYANSMTVTLSSGTVYCYQEIPVFEDTVYHTFVFQQPVGNTSCP